MPRLSRCRRRASAIFAVLAMLFAQLALASYACPALADALAMAQPMDTPCAGMDPVQPALCHQHAAGSEQSFEIAKLAAPVLPVALPALRLVPAAEPASATKRAPSPASRPPPEPLFLATLRLRV